MSFPTYVIVFFCFLSEQVVLQKCQDQRQCQVQAATSVFGQDPCPGTSKYLEVAYKCRPSELFIRLIFYAMFFWTSLR